MLYERQLCLFPHSLRFHPVYVDVEASAVQPVPSVRHRSLHVAVATSLGQSEESANVPGELELYVRRHRGNDLQARSRAARVAFAAVGWGGGGAAYARRFRSVWKLKTKACVRRLLIVNSDVWATRPNSFFIDINPDRLLRKERNSFLYAYLNWFPPESPAFTSLQSSLLLGVEDLGVGTLWGAKSQKGRLQISGVLSRPRPPPFRLLSFPRVFTLTLMHFYLFLE